MSVVKGIRYLNSLNLNPVSLFVIVARSLCR